MPMKPKNVSFTLLIILVVLIGTIYRLRSEPKPKEAFNRTTRSLVYTIHALCRMECRQITKEEIEEIARKGAINFNKSNKRNQPCPTFALQARTSDGQYVRVIFAQCNNNTKVITCYDLEQDFMCNCPGDDKKNN